MAVVGNIRAHSGFRHAQVFALDVDGYPAASDTNAYAGVHLEGAKVLEMNDPEPRQVTHSGDDTVFQLDMLPASEPLLGTLNTGKMNDTADAILSADNSFTVGEAKFMGINTDNKGNENQVAILAYSQAVDAGGGAADGARRWESRLLPRALVARIEHGFAEETVNSVYNIYPQFVTKHLWGTDFSCNVEGFNRAQALRGVSQYEPWITAFKADNATVIFILDVTSADATKTVVWLEGVEQTTVTATVTNITFTTTPGSDERIVVFHEVNNPDACT